MASGLCSRGRPGQQGGQRAVQARRRDPSGLGEPRAGCGRLGARRGRAAQARGSGDRGHSYEHGRASGGPLPRRKPRGQLAQLCGELRSQGASAPAPRPCAAVLWHATQEQDLPRGPWLPGRLPGPAPGAGKRGGGALHTAASTRGRWGAGLSGGAHLGGLPGQPRRPRARIRRWRALDRCTPWVVADRGQHPRALQEAGSGSPGPWPGSTPSHDPARELPGLPQVSRVRGPDRCGGSRPGNRDGPAHHLRLWHGGAGVGPSGPEPLRARWSAPDPQAGRGGRTKGLPGRHARQIRGDRSSRARAAGRDGGGGSL